MNRLNKIFLKNSLTSVASVFNSFPDLEGKKAHLEGTWSAVGGHLEGRAETLQTLINSRVAGQKLSTWRVLGKSIYRNCGTNMNHRYTKEADHE